ncbi:BapA/Bap/LapF family prefix-like domain-containing protein, partial [Acinetobacter populi]
MAEIKVVSKDTHKTLEEVQGNTVSLNEDSVIILKINPDDVLEIKRDGNSAVIILKSGETIIIVNFFNEGSNNSLVLEDDNHKLIWAQFTDQSGALLDNAVYGYIDNIEPLLYHDGISPLWALAPLATVAALKLLDNDNHHFAKDTTPPDKPSTPEGFVDNEGNEQGAFPGGTSTDDTTPGIVIGDVGEDTPTLYVDGEEVESVYDPETGTLTPVNPLPEGEHDITYTVTDPAGNESAPSDPIVVIVDTTAPDKPSTPEGFVDNEGSEQGTFPGGTSTDDTTPGIVIGDVGEDTPTLYVDGEEVESVYDPETGTLTPVNPLPEGEHDITYTVTDPAGNESAPSDPIVVIVDTTAPTQLAITEVIDDVEFVTGVITAGGYTNDRTPTVNGTGAESNALITLKDTDGNVLGTATADADGNWSVEPTLANQL